jgi:hypothetical protein
MNLKNFFKQAFLAVLAMSALNAAAGNIDATTARMTANSFWKQKAATGKFKAASTADIKLSYTEKSSVSGNAFYVFNIDGGGWVIVAGDDRAKQVLAYGNTGNIDMDNMPGNMKAYLNMLKGQIETAQAYKGKTVPVKASKNRTVVEPLLKTNWGQGEPWNRLCPVNGAGETTSVGCAPLAMAQVLYYWKYPNEVSEMPGYPGTGYQWYPSMPATTFDFDLIIDQYRYYDPVTGNPTIVDYTDEQANEVAKLSRYCGQACKSRYGNSGTSTGSYSYDQRDGFKTFGYNENLQLIGKDPSYYNDNSNKYSIDEWCELIRIELEAGRPIPYHDMWEGHAWVLDGVDADGKFHMNWGFNGKFDGWYEIDAMSFHPYGDSEIWDFSQSSNSGNEMVINCIPYEGYVIPGDEPQGLRGDVNMDNDVTIKDVTVLIDYLLSNDATGISLENADCNLKDGVTIADVTALIDYLLSGNW